MELTPEQTNEVVARVLDSLRTESGIKSQAVLADMTGLSAFTLQKLLSGKQAIKIPQFLQMVAPMAFTPEEAIERIEAAVEREKALMSAGVPNLEALRAKKQQAHVRDMTPDQIDTITKKAATNDPELEQPEPDTP